MIIIPTAEQERLTELARKAHYAVSRAVKFGKLPRIETVACQGCDEQASDYHHHNGYEPECWLDVIPLCSKCHRRTEQELAPKCQGTTQAGDPCKRMAYKGMDLCYHHLEERNAKSVTFTVRMPAELIEALKKKAGDTPVSVVIRRLIEMYIKGEVRLD